MWINLGITAAALATMLALDMVVQDQAAWSLRRGRPRLPLRGDLCERLRTNRATLATLKEV